MASSAPATRGLIPGGGRPALIAHAAGNNTSRIRQAIDEGADYLEVDLWVQGGRFEARHARKLHPFPVLWENWQLRWAPRFAFGLVELIREARGRAGIFLDFKNGGEVAARLVRRSIDEAGGNVSIAASSQHWSALRALQHRAPEVALFYSIDVAAKLDLFLSVSQRDALPSGISCYHRLLTRPLVDRLHDAGLLVVAWTVDELDRAAELVSWGVDGVTTHRIPDVRGRLASANM